MTVHVYRLDASGDISRGQRAVSHRRRGTLLTS